LQQMSFSGDHQSNQHVFCPIIQKKVDELSLNTDGLNCTWLKYVRSVFCPIIQKKVDELSLNTDGLNCTWLKYVRRRLRGHSCDLGVYCCKACRKVPGKLVAQRKSVHDYRVPRQTGPVWAHGQPTESLTVFDQSDMV